MTWIKKFTNPNTVTGYSNKPDLQKEVKGKKYFDIRIPQATKKSLKLEAGDLLEVMIRNSDGDTQFFKKETSKRTGGLKFYLPRSVVEELAISENEVLDIFLSKD